MKLLNACFKISTIFGWLSYHHYDQRKFEFLNKSHKLINFFVNFNIIRRKQIYQRKLYLIFIRKIQFLTSVLYIYFEFFYSTKNCKEEKLNDETIKAYFFLIRKIGDLVMFNGMMTYGVTYSEDLAKIFGQNFEIINELGKSRLMNIISKIFLCILFSSIPFEMVMVIFVIHNPNSLSSDFEYNISCYLHDYALRYFVILLSSNYCLLFHLFVTTESQKLNSISETILNSIKVDSIKCKKKLFLNILNSLNNLKMYHIGITNYFGFPLFLVLSFGVTSTITELFFLSFATSLNYWGGLWSFFDFLLSISFFIPLVTAVSMALYQVRKYYWA